MSEELLPDKRKGIITPEILAGVLVVLILVGVFIPTMGTRYSEKGNITKGISNCRQIGMALKLYAADHDGAYPDASLTITRSANAAFRGLFQSDTIDSEAIFGCPVSPYVPDGKVGDSKDSFMHALEPGENHWMMTAGLNTSKPESIPLVYENANGTRWSPRWNADAKQRVKPGRTWSGGVIVGLNDGSVSLHRLASDKGTAVGLRPESSGEDIFEMAIDLVNFPKGEVLDVE
jgi:hypothetical protein